MLPRYISSNWHQLTWACVPRDVSPWRTALYLVWLWLCIDGTSCDIVHWNWRGGEGKRGRGGGGEKERGRGREGDGERRRGGENGRGMGREGGGERGRVRVGEEEGRGNIRFRTERESLLSKYQSSLTLWILPRQNDRQTSSVQPRAWGWAWQVLIGVPRYPPRYESPGVGGVQGVWSTQYIIVTCK